LDYDAGNGAAGQGMGEELLVQSRSRGRDLMTPLAFNLGRCKRHKQDKRAQDIELVGKVGVT